MFGVNCKFENLIRLEILDQIEAAGSDSGKPTTSVRIIECGRSAES